MLTISLAKTEKAFQGLMLWILGIHLGKSTCGPWEYGEDIFTKLTCVLGLEAQYGLNCWPPQRL
jgi:hypothetical protein